MRPLVALQNRRLANRLSFQQDVDATPKAVRVCSFVPQHVRIQKDRGRARYTQRSASLKISTNLLINLIAVHVRGELINLQVELPRIRNERRTRIVLVFPLVLVAIKSVVHLPELILITRGLRGVGRRHRILVDPRQWKMMKDNLNPGILVRILNKIF